MQQSSPLYHFHTDLRIQPVAALEAGIVILDPVLVPTDFAFQLLDSGRGSGGDYAYGEYVRYDRRLELHFRHSLGLVTYHVGSNALSHEAYMKALGVGRTQYPGYSDDPLDGFRHLAADLIAFGDDFVRGDAVVLVAHAPLEAQQRADQWRSEQAWYEGDDDRRRQAMSLVREKDYGRALAVFDSLHYPDLLSNTELRAREMARTHANDSGSAPDVV